MWPPKKPNDHFDRVPKNDTVNKRTGGRVPPPGGKVNKRSYIGVLLHPCIEILNPYQNQSKTLRFWYESMKECKALKIGLLAIGMKE